MEAKYKILIITIAILMALFYAIFSFVLGSIYFLEWGLVARIIYIVIMTVFITIVCKQWGERYEK